MAPVRDEMERLRQAAEALNAATDGLNEVIEQLEDELAKIGVGLTYWLDEYQAQPAIFDHQEQNDRRAKGWTLGYTKIGDRWRLAVREVTVEVPSEEDDPISRTPWSFLRRGTAVPLLTAPRIVRAEAAPELERLVSGLRARADHLTEGVDKARDAVTK